MRTTGHRVQGIFIKDASRHFRLRKTAICSRFYVTWSATRCGLNYVIVRKTGSMVVPGEMFMEIKRAAHCSRRGRDRVLDSGDRLSTSLKRKPRWNPFAVASCVGLPTAASAGSPNPPRVLNSSTRFVHEDGHERNERNELRPLVSPLPVLACCGRVTC